MSAQALPVLDFILNNYKHFNSRALRDALLSYWQHIEGGGKMFWALAGAMSTAQLGISLAPAIREGLIHGFSVTGANLEESMFRLVAHDSYKDIPEYRYLTKAEDACLLDMHLSRITDTTLPEKEVFKTVESLMSPLWDAAAATGDRLFWHEYFYKTVLSLSADETQGSPDECWLLAAAEKNIPIVVPGYEDSSVGNYFAGLVKKSRCPASAVKSGIEYMAWLYDQYEALSFGAGVGFFQIGGGIAGDFPMCVVPSIKQDLGLPAKHWAYFCQVSDSITSYGSYSGAPPNEKITWDKLSEKTPMFVIESDATIVAPLILQALLECKRNPLEARDKIAKHLTQESRRARV
jgi:deoxyhypusine synthase